MTLQETKTALSNRITAMRESVATTKMMADPEFNKRDPAGWATIYQLEVSELAMLESSLHWLNTLSQPEAKE